MTKKFKIVGTKSLEGCKVGFFIPRSMKLFVSPSVAKLAADDILLLKNLKVFNMRYRNGQPQHADLDSWVLDVATRHDIFGERENGTPDE